MEKVHISLRESVVCVVGGENCFTSSSSLQWHSHGRGGKKLHFDGWGDQNERRRSVFAPVVYVRRKEKRRFDVVSIRREGECASALFWHSREKFAIPSPPRPPPPSPSRNSPMLKGRNVRKIPHKMEYKGESELLGFCKFSKKEHWRTPPIRSPCAPILSSRVPGE